MADEIAPQPGQVWADNDKRSTGRKLLIQRTDGQYAYCLARGGSRMVRIRLDRFRPTSTGYRYVGTANWNEWVL